MRTAPLTFALLAAGAAPAVAAPLPEGVRQMIEAAAASDDPAVFAAVLATARKVAPDAGAEIEALVDAHPAPRGIEELAAAAPSLAEPAAASAWKGSVELGGSHAAGSADVAALYGVADVAWVGEAWTHKLTSRADYQETGRRVDTRRLSLAYQPQRRYGGALYTYGLGQFEHDRSIGVRERYTLGAGAGVQALETGALTIGIEAGPAIRRTVAYGQAPDEAVAGRASLQLKWTPFPRVTFAQNTAVYFEREQANTRSITSVETLLFGPLKGRLSYNVQHEFDRRIGRSALDTTTRASLLYAF